MRKIYLCLILAFVAIQSPAQSMYSDIKLDNRTDYRKAQEKVLEACSLLLTTRFDPDNLDRLYAIQFIMKWMAGTPDYHFQLADKFTNAFSNEPDILGLYMAAISQLALQSKASQAESTLQLEALKVVLKYGEMPAHNLRFTGELKKMDAAFRKGALESYLGLQKDALAGGRKQ